MARPVLIATLLCLALAAPAFGGVPLWTHNSTEPVRAVALSSDGNITAVASDYFHLFNRTGSLIATSFRANDVAVVSSGELTVSGTEDEVHAFSANGTELWSAPNATAALAVSEDGGTIAVLGLLGDLSLYDSEGSLIGSAAIDAKGEGVRVAVSRSGAVVAAAYERGLRVFSGGGGQRWAVELPSPYAIAVNASGGLVAVGDGGSVKFFNSTGERLGRVLTGAPVRSVAMASAGNTTVAGAGDGSLLAFGPDGTLRWKRAVGRGTRGTTHVAVSQSGAVVAATAGEGMLLVYDQNGTMLWEAPLAGTPRALALSADGTTVAAGTDEGTAYLFETGVTPAPTPTRAARNATVNRTAGNASAGAATERVEGDLAVRGNLTVMGNLAVMGNVTAGGEVTVEGNRAASRNATGAGKLPAGANATVGENLTAGGDLAVEGNPTLEDILPAEENPMVEDTLPAEENPMVEDTLTAEETLIIEGYTTAEEYPAVDDDLADGEDQTDVPTLMEAEDSPSATITKTPATVSQTATGSRTATVARNTTVSTNATGAGIWTAAGDATAAGNGRAGDVIIGGEMTAPGSLTVEGNLTVEGGLRVRGDLEAQGSVTENDAAAARTTGNATGTAPSATTVAPAVTATGNATPSRGFSLPWNASTAWTGPGNARGYGTSGPAATMTPDAGQAAYNGTHALPGTVQAEDFDTGGEGVAYHDGTAENKAATYSAACRPNESVDAGTENGISCIGWITDGEWTEYTVNVSGASSYIATFRAGAWADGRRIALTVDGARGCEVGVPNTGSNGTYREISAPLSLANGTHVIRLGYQGDGITIDWFRVAAGSPLRQQAGFPIPLAAGAALALAAFVLRRHG